MIYAIVRALRFFGPMTLEEIEVKLVIAKIQVPRREIEAALRLLVESKHIRHGTPKGVYVWERDL